MPSPTNGKGLTAEETKALWASADKLRGNLDSANYKNVVLGLIFLKYISDTFQRLYTELQNTEYANAEDREEYAAQNVFFVPEDARWQKLADSAKLANIGVLIDNAMRTIERENTSLKGVLPQEYARPELDKRSLGGLIDIIGKITLSEKDSHAQDKLGQVYEYFLSQFASNEGKRGGEFYTAKSVVTLLVEMLEPYEGRIYDPCCGSGGMFVQSEKFIQAHGGSVKNISIFGQEKNATTWRLCKMNLAIRGIEGNIGARSADTFHQNLHRNLRADYILANPPFNMSDWGGELLQNDPRWAYGMPPAGNANYAWIQHMIYHLSAKGRAGFVLSNSSMSSNTSNEGVIRTALINADLIECMVALPGKLFYSTAIHVCLWFISKAKPEHRQGQVLFIDAHNIGYMIDRTQRDFSDEDITKIATIHRVWRTPDGDYADELGFCKSVGRDEIAKHGDGLTPGRYVGTAEKEADDEPFPEKMQRLTTQLKEQFAESARLEAIIKENLRILGYE